MTPWFALGSAPDALGPALVHNSDVGRVHPWRWSSGDALGHGHAKLGHDVDDLAASRGFGLLCWQSPGVEAAANQGFVRIIATSPKDRRP